MLVALTNSKDSTADFLLSTLKRAGVPFLRLDTDTLISRLQIRYIAGKPELRTRERRYYPGEISNVWYRRPEEIRNSKSDSTPESKYALMEWTEFLECFFAHVPADRWMNHPSRNAAASRKLEVLSTAVGLGLKVPDTLATQDPQEFRSFYERHGGNVIVKPLSTGYVERPGEGQDSLIYTNLVGPEHLKNLDDLKNCPTFFQQRIRKRSDLRITIVDADLHAVELQAAESVMNPEQRCDIRRNNMEDVSYRIVSLPSKIERQIWALMHHYGLRFGAVDMAVSLTGEYYFFEVNANGQWAWLDQCAGTQIAASFVKSFTGRPRA